MGMTQGNDSVSKNIQNQIANAQQKLQDLSILILILLVLRSKIRAPWRGDDLASLSLNSEIRFLKNLAQQKLQDLSSNEEMSLEDKMKKRQEIQQEINNLNQLCICNLILNIFTYRIIPLCHSHCSCLRICPTKSEATGFIIE